MIETETTMDNAKRGKLIQDSLVAGFKGGWRAAMETLAGQFEQMLEAIAKRGENPREYGLNASDWLKLIRAQANHAPTPAAVEVRPGESLASAMARAPAPVIGNAAPPPRRSAIPSAEEALPHLAGLLATQTTGGDLRTKRAEWIALVGFAMFTRDCAALDGVLSEIDREAARLRDHVAGMGSSEIPSAGPIGTPAARA